MRGQAFTAFELITSGVSVFGGKQATLTKWRSVNIMSNENSQLPNIHPGEILLEEFLQPFGLTPYRLAKSIGVQQTRIAQIIDGKRSITTDSAIRLGAFFNTTPQFWLNLQQAFDLENAIQDPARTEEYSRILCFVS